MLTLFTGKHETNPPILTAKEHLFGEQESMIEIAELGDGTGVLQSFGILLYLACLHVRWPDVELQKANTLCIFSWTDSGRHFILDRVRCRPAQK